MKRKVLLLASLILVTYPAVYGYEGFIGPGVVATETSGPSEDIEKPYVPLDPAEIIGDVSITVVSAKANQAQGGEEIEFTIDGDPQTIYHSPYSFRKTTFPVSLEYRFERPEAVDYAVYYPRLGGGNGDFGEVELYVSTTEQPEYRIAGTYDFEFKSTPGVMMFPERKEDVLGFKILVKTGMSNYASCSEMKFMRYGEGSDPRGFSHIFGDDVLSELRTEITREEIEKMNNALFRDVALKMFDGKYSREFRIEKFEPLPVPADVVEPLKVNAYNFWETPTGIYFDQGDEIVVVVGDTGGEEPTLRVFDRNPGGMEQTFILRKGVNKYISAGKGLAYLVYYTKNWETTAPDIRMHFVTGKTNGYFDLQRHTAQQGLEMINNAPAEFFDMLGRHSQVVFSVDGNKGNEGLRKFCTDPVSTMNAYDAIVTGEWELMGLYKYDRVPKKTRMFVRWITSGSPSGGRGGANIPDGAMNNACNGDMIMNGPWMLVHELGHVNQLNPGLKWVGTTEVTNNIYSSVLWWEFPINHAKLELEQCDIQMNPRVHELGGRMNCYLNYGVVQGHPWMQQWGQDDKTPFDDSYGGDHFVKLCPLWQLMVYYRFSEGAPWYKPDWYGDVCEVVRMTSQDGKSQGRLMVDFMRNTIDAVGQDLTGFFETAGMLKPVDRFQNDYSSRQLTITQAMVDELKDYARKYPRPDTPVLNYISTQSLPAYINKLPVEGEFNKGITENHVDQTLTIDHGVWNNVTVFETYKGEELYWVSMVGTAHSSMKELEWKRTSTLVHYPEGSTRVEAVAWDGTRTLVYGNR